MSSSSLNLFRAKLEQRKQKRLEIQSKNVDLFRSHPNDEESSNDETRDTELDCQIELFLINYLIEPLNDLPASSYKLLYELNKHFSDRTILFKRLERVLIKFESFKLVRLERLIEAPDVDIDFETRKQIEYQTSRRLINVIDVDLNKFSFYKKRFRTSLKRSLHETSETSDDNDLEMDMDMANDDEQDLVMDTNAKARMRFKKFAKRNQKVTLNSNASEYVEKLLLKPSSLDLKLRTVTDEVNEILCRETACEKLKLANFKARKPHVKEYCRYMIKEECMEMRKKYRLGYAARCDKIHFKRIIRAHTDPALGDCSFLNTCYHTDTCKYIHYETDMDDFKANQEDEDSNGEENEHLRLGKSFIINREISKIKKLPPQWINCDLRSLDMSILGKFAVIMADPPWDIHMELPYGTMEDDEMKKLNIPSLQDDGYIFLWVTGRAMELGRECLKIWGYERCDELIWVKTNQLQRIIRTGRTGHWLNHGKEHCLVGVKGNIDPKLFNRMIDSDIVVAEVRATSRKPDEIYGVIERLSPGTRKIELFGRPHNVQPNWITLGNQLDGVRLFEPEIVKLYKSRYPNDKNLNSQASAHSSSSANNTGESPQSTAN